MYDMPHCSFIARQALTPAALADAAPAIFAGAADTQRTSARYTFISTAQLVRALAEAGFEARDARQMPVRGGGSGEHARHMIRFTHIRESITLVDAVPEIVLVNSHDGTTGYTLRAGLYRPVCTNGMIAHAGDFGLIHVPHRGDVLEDVVNGALALTRGFADIGAVVERMAQRELDERERWDFAAQALAVRYHAPDRSSPITPDQALLPRRAVDYGASLWQAYNVVQENLIRGGIVGRTQRGRRACTRAIRAIREDVRINAELWRLAMRMIQS